jgi:hypothetical protein
VVGVEDEQQVEDAPDTPSSTAYCSVGTPKIIFRKLAV